MLLKPFHKFHDDNGTCLINVSEMTVCRIDEEISLILDRLSTDPAFSVPCGMEEHLKNLGLISDEDRPQKKKGLTEPVAIREMALFVTQKCNFSCVYCYGDGGGYGSEGEMDRNTAFRAVEWLIEQSIKSKRLTITFFGGEPLLNFKLIKGVVSYARKRGKESGKVFRFTLCTNGSLLDHHKINFIKEHNIHVNVGFDGPKEVQDAQRPFRNGKSSYDVTESKIRSLLQVMPDTTGRATLLGPVDPVRVKKAMAEIGFSRVAVEVASPPILDRGKGFRNQEAVFSSMAEMAEAEAEELLTAIKERNAEKVKALRHGNDTMVSRSLGCFAYHTRRYFFCGAGRKYVAVSSEGDVYPCHRFVGIKAYRLGSIFMAGVNREIYHKSPIRFVDKCSVCFARYACAGGCYHDNLAVSGSIFNPNELRCRLMRRSVEFLASLTCRLNREDEDFLTEKEIIPKDSCVLDF